MKNTNKLKLILFILISVLIILLGFIGVYTKQGNSYKNIFKDYKLSSDIKGSTVIEFDVDGSVNTKYYDEDGKEVKKEDIKDEDLEKYKTEETPVNSEDVLTTENFEKTVKILKRRLKFLQADQYRIDLDKTSGKIVLVIDDDYMEDIENLIALEGRLKLIDSNTGDVILDYTDFESADANYVSLDEGYSTYLNLKLNKSGLEKIKDIDKYKVSKVTTEKSEDNKEDTTSVTAPKFKLMFDTDQICEMEYENNLLLTGKTLRITTKNKITSTSTVNSQLNVLSVVSSLATYGKLPVVYKLSAEEFVKADILEYGNYIAGAAIIICALIICYLIIKYKINGVLAALGFVDSIALTLFLIRVVGVVISLNALTAFVAIIILNALLTINLLKEILNKDKDFKEVLKTAYLKIIDLSVIIVIMIIVFAFASMSAISSVGLILFWGFVSSLLGNLIFTVPMLYTFNN